MFLHISFEGSRHIVLIPKPLVCKQKVAQHQYNVGALEVAQEKKLHVDKTSTDKLTITYSI